MRVRISYIEYHIKLEKVPADNVEYGVPNDMLTK